MRERRTSCPRGTISLLTQKPRTAHTAANRTGQRTTDSRLTPQALIAAISLSAERRENTRMELTSSASGIDHWSVSGSATRQNSPTTGIGTPSITRSTICTRSPIVNTNDSTRNASRKLDRNEPNTYLSIVFKTCSNYWNFRTK